MTLPILANKKVAICFALVCMFLWGSAFPMIKLGYLALGIAPENIFGKLYFAGLRFTGASLLVFCYHLILYKKPLTFNKRQFPLAFSLSFLQLAGQYFFFYIALAHTTGVKSSVLQSSATFITVILAHFLLKNDTLTKNKLLALFFGFLGIISANIVKGFDFDFSFLGEGFMLIAALLSSFGNIVVKRFGKESNPFFLSFWQFLIGGLTLLLIGYIGGGSALHFNLFSFTLLAYGSFISATAFVLWYSYPVGEISIYRLFIPIFGAMLSALIIPGEHFNLAIFCGLAFVIFGVRLLNRKA